MSASRQMQMPQVKYSVTAFGGGQTAQGVAYPGGLDLTTPSLRLQPGALRDCLNFECAQSGGYARIGGYERVDGQTSPSTATYQIVQVASFTNTPTVGQTVTQATSGATGKIVAVVTTTPYVVVTQVTGSFDTTHALTTPGPVTVGTAVPVTVSVDAATSAQYTALAADVYRALIGAVPGSGKVLGVVAMTFSGVDNLYAFRANVGGTAVAIYKKSVSGWTLVPLFNTINWTAGATSIALDGETLTQGGVTATIKRVMWQSGTTGASTAAGTFVITTPTGGNFAGGAATTTSGAAMTLSGIQTAITITPGGRYQFVKCNFTGQAATRRIYGCDGVNKCFEFDGVTYAPIKTGLSPDQPTHIMFHYHYLVIAQGSSIIGCGVGTPFKWTSTDGGWEIATGDTVVDMITLPGSQTTPTLAVYSNNNTSFLYGTDPTTFKFVSFNTGSGAVQYSAQNLSDTFVMDVLGVVTLKTTLNWGNFLPTSLTKNILPFILQEQGKLTASAVQRTKSQYRTFFSDGFGLYLTAVNSQYLGATLVQFPNPVYVCDEDIASTGVEISYFGSTDGQGYIYQMDTGPSFDGAVISAFVNLAWDPIKSPRILKRFRAASLEMQGNAYAQVQFGYQLGYGTPLIGQPTAVALTSSFSSAPHWDSFTWDNFTWDGNTLSPSDIDVTGTAENIQLIVASGTNYIQPYTLDSVIWHYSMRRGIRV